LLDLLAELTDLLGQRRRVWTRGLPLPPTGVFLGDQLLLFVAQ
jgi:hypothetical protein